MLAAWELGVFWRLVVDSWESILSLLLRADKAAASCSYREPVCLVINKPINKTKDVSYNPEHYSGDEAVGSA